MAKFMVDLSGWFLDYQDSWIVDESDLKLARKGRQTGFTYTAGYRVVRKCLQLPKLDWWWVSRDETFGKEFVNYVKDWCRVANFVADLGEFRTPKRGSTWVEGNSSFMDLGKDVMVMKVTFPNASRLHVLTSSPHAAAGKSGYVTLDEFDLHKDQKALYNVVMPITTWGGSLEVISTHEGGTASTFNQFVRGIEEDGNPMEWSYHMTTIVDAVEAGLVKKINRRRAQYGKKPLTDDEFLADCRRKCESEEAWLEKYMCQPAADKRALIPYDQILRAELEWSNLQAESSTGTTYLGMDIGRHRDLTILWLIERVGPYYFTRSIWESSDGDDYDDYERALDDAIDKWHPLRVAIDSSTKGEMLAEHAVKKYGEDRILSINMASKPVQETVATATVIAFERDIIRIPCQPNIRRDIYAVERHVSEGGVIKFFAPSHPDGHSDRFWALALAIFAASGDAGSALAERLAKVLHSADRANLYLTAEEEDDIAAEVQNDNMRGF